MSVQFIENNGMPEYAVIPAEDYETLLKKAEMLDDVVAFDKAVATEDELLPVELVTQLVSGENKVKVWRNYRGLTQMQLAQATNLTQAYIGQVETGKREGSVKVLVVIAEALGVDVDDLVS